MRTTVKKWGNSIAIRIPKSFACEIGIVEASTVDISIRDDSLVITPLTSSELSLEELMSGVTDDNLHEEIDTGPVCRREV
ncbi:MAG: AbrB/MazE/SpoVT family DNA-binding domain-containing protein [Armatimonadota bacterium]